MIVGPLPIEVPLAHPPAYHFHDAPVPNDPPTTLILVLPPTQIAGDAALAPVGAVDNVFTVTITDAHVVLLHSPSALTKYVVVADGVTIIDGPVPIAAPLAHPPAYHFHVAFVPNEPPVTLRVVVCPTQRTLATAEALVGFVDKVLTETVTEAQLEVPQSPSALT